MMSTVPALVGKDLAAPDTVGNTADVDLVANPDNIKFSERLRTLLIGEDSANHVNNFLWAYEVDTGRLARILSCPSGAESTGLHDKVKDALWPLINQQYRNRRSAAVGYIHGLPQQV